MGSRRFWLKSLAALLVLLLMLAGYAAYRVHGLLDAQGLQLDWRSLGPTWQGLHAEDLSLLRDDGSLRLHAEQVRLRLWPHSSLSLHGLQVEVQASSGESRSEPPLDLGQLAAILPWLPAHIQLQSIDAHLPCARGRCTLAGDLELRQQGDALQLSAQLLRGEHHAELRATLEGLAPTRDTPRHLTASLLLDEQLQMLLDTRLQPEAAGLRWQGELGTPGSGDLAWVVDWLGEWLLRDDTALPQAPRQMALNAQWQVQLGDTAALSHLLQSPGWLQLDAQLPEPWPVPRLGLLSGTLALHLENLGTRWQARQLQGELQLDPGAAPWQAQIAEGLDSGPLTLRLSPVAKQDETDIALHLALSSQGPLRLEAEAELALGQWPGWQLQVRQAHLHARSERLQLADSQLGGIDLKLQLAGMLAEQHVDLQLEPGSQLTLERVQQAEVQARRLHAELAALKLTGSPQSPQLSGPLKLELGELRQAVLNPQGWRWQGEVQATLDEQSATGSLAADSGLQLGLQLQRDAASGMRLDARLDELFLRAGNPLPATLRHWPPLLSLDQGRLHGQAHLALPVGQPLHLNAELSGKGLAGIYDRSSLSGVDGTLRLALDGDRLNLQLADLQAAEIDPGIVLGPLKLQGSYQARLNKPGVGQVHLQQAQLGVLDGQLSLDATRWDLAQPEQVLPLQLRGLNLETLFRVYPTEGLAGSGLIDGTLPVHLGTGLSIEGGQIQARPPGGRLRFDSPRIRAMGQTNPGMKLVTDALQDFHYDLLSSSLDYDSSGTLRLGIRLHGQNPAIEQGRPIHFNINLEEDIPALLASLQLTGKVNDIIQRRIQQRMRQRVPQAPKE
ncbi:YdbH domain-containing protein [Pseudomonas sp. AA-38]|uniref:YdbH domain-containing protein n=1 Tax=Pseudomonas sp. AA-38 TaxID=3028807 RepID=UPI0023F686CE|nr:YdbH domain-containing protein [Pseudomonas sp. AA-38]